MLKPNANDGPSRDPRLVRAICLLAIAELLFFAAVTLIVIWRSRDSEPVRPSAHLTSRLGATHDPA